MNNKTDITSFIGIGLILIAVIALGAILWSNFSDEDNGGDEPAEIVETSPTEAPAPAPQNTVNQGELPAPQVQVVEGAPQAPEPEPQEPAPAEPEQVEPTEEPQPEPTEATESPTEAAPADPMITAGSDGVNVRKGPGTNYDRIGTLAPGAQAKVVGKYVNWWQIEYSGGLGWVYNAVVTAANTDNIPQVQPPPAPTAVPPTATPKPQPTNTPVPQVDTRGLSSTSYYVENAPGPFGVNDPIWFNMQVVNSNGWDVEYESWGTYVAESKQFQKSWTTNSFRPGTNESWRDRVKIPQAGNYTLYMRVCFMDGYCANLAGPISVTVQ